MVPFFFAIFSLSYLATACIPELGSNTFIDTLKLLFATLLQIGRTSHMAKGPRAILQDVGSSVIAIDP